MVSLTNVLPGQLLHFEKLWAALSTFSVRLHACHLIVNFTGLQWIFKAFEIFSYPSTERFPHYLRAVMKILPSLAWYFYFKSIGKLHEHALLQSVPLFTHCMNSEGILLHLRLFTSLSAYSYFNLNTFSFSVYLCYFFSCIYGKKLYISWLPDSCYILSPSLVGPFGQKSLLN